MLGERNSLREDRFAALKRRVKPAVKPRVRVITSAFSSCR